MNLQNLYQHLIVNHQYHWQGWHDEYVILRNAMKRIRDILESDSLKNIKDIDYNDESIKNLVRIGKNTDVKDHKSFLKLLFYDENNSISSRGQSILSYSNLEKLQDNVDFIDCVTKIIKHDESNLLDLYNNIENIWVKSVGSKNPLLLCRFIAACSEKVSTTVDEGKFNNVIAWLKTENICDPNKLANITGSWIEKNWRLMELFDKELNSKFAAPIYDTYWRNMFVWAIYENMTDKFQMKKAIVKYGPPGTGKTYKAKESAKLQFNIWKDFYASENNSYNFSNYIETVQFHPSYTYEDFIEGLRPILVNNQSQLCLQNGTFKDFCIKAGKWEKDLVELDPNINWKDITIEELQKYLGKELPDWQEKEHWKYIFEYAKKGNRNTKIFDALPPYFFIIDEINRADLSRVFGELMYCLEYRGVEGCIRTQYSGLNTPDTGMLKIDNEYKFFIPNNVYVIGTMNTIDRSVESFDFALRRRFSWEEVSPDNELLRNHLKKNYKIWEGLADRLANLNSKICKEKQLLGPDYQIGHAYFWNLPDPTMKDLSENQLATIIWNDRIKPLLQEYLRGTGRDEELICELRKSMIN